MNIALTRSVAILGLFVFTLVNVEQARAEIPAATAATMKAVTIPVKGMACMACVGKTKQALRGVPGVTEVEVKLNPGSAIVKYDAAKLTPEKLVAVIKELGYEAELPAAKNSK